MEITVSQIPAATPVTVLHLEGQLDGNHYQELINQAQRQYDSGTRRLLLDLSRLTYISSAGLSALHTVALLFRGQGLVSHEDGWASLHAMDNDRSNGTQENVKLVNPSPDVQKVLDIVGFKALFEIYSDLRAAAASFNTNVDRHVSVS